MAECCCSSSRGPWVEVRHAIEAENKEFFEQYAKQGKQYVVYEVLINETYSTLEYTIIRRKQALLSYFLDDQRWDVTKFDGFNNLQSFLKDVCKNKNKQGALLVIEDIREILGILQAKGILTDKEPFEMILDKNNDSKSKYGSRCRVM